MRQVIVRPLAAVVSAVILGSGVYVAQDRLTDGGGGAPAGTANLWVESGAGSCTRAATPVDYDGSASPDARCGSLDQAYDAANASSEASTVLIKGGTYGAQGVTGSRTGPNRIVFDVPDGETVTIDGTVEFGIWPPDGSAPAQGPDYVTLKNIVLSTFVQDGGNSRHGIFVRPGSSFLRFENLTTGGFNVGSSHDIEFVDGSYGPCYADPVDPYDPEPDQPGESCDINRVDHTACEGFHADCQPPQDILVEGIFFHDYTYGPGDGCVNQGNNTPPVENPDGCHHRSMYINGVNGFTLRGSTFKNSVFQPWSTHSGTPAGASGNTNFLIENNEFAQGDTFAPGGFGWAFAWCQNGHYDNVILRFNSFARTTTIGMPDTVSASPAECEASNFKIYGNVVGKDDCTVTGPGINTATNITWRYNVFAGNDTSGTCDATDVNVGGTTMPWYTNDVLQPDPGDFALTGATAAPDNLVPADDPDYPCPATDYDGTPRPSGAGQFCDAGAHER